MAANKRTIELVYKPRGAAQDLFSHRESEVCLDGPAGTGKTRAVLEKIHLALLKYPNTKAIMLRKTLSSLKTSALETYANKVLHPLDGVSYFGGSQREAPQYRYPNGSKLFLGGLDKPDKVMSSEYDIAYINEATECQLDDIEKVKTRLRNNIMPYQQLLMDCNPQNPAHWLNQRMNAGLTTRLLSRHVDNPAMTPEYLEMLSQLTGVRRARLFLGLWMAADGGIYEDTYDAARNIIDRRSICSRVDLYGDCGIPREWPRYMVIDFGHTNPLVCQWYAVDNDGRAYLYREIYMTKKLVEDHAADIKAIAGWGKTNGDPLPRAIICDHDAEDRKTLERHLGLYTMAAHKAVSPGIQAVSARFRNAGDGKPRLMILRDSLVKADRDLADRKLPTCTAEEVEGYVWDTRNAKKGEQPLKENDHGCDAMRYLIAHLDVKPSTVDYGPDIW